MPKGTLFDDKAEFDSNPPKFTGSVFSVVNRSGREELARIRQTIEKWFDEYKQYNPDSAKDLKGRYRSNDDEHHYSALTELYLHHFLIEQGFRPQVHPQFPNSSSKPDFLALKGEQPRFVVEALSVCESKENARLQKLEAAIIEALKALKLPFFLDVKFRSTDSLSQPKLKELKREVLAWANTVTRCSSADMEYHWKQKQWHIVFRVEPDAPPGGIGWGDYYAHRITLDETIREKVLKKVNRYGKLDVPFIIALNVIREKEFCDDEIVMEALSGEMKYDFSQKSGGSSTWEVSAKRGDKGIWVASQGKVVRRRISGLLVLQGLTDATIEKTQSVLWHHPFAEIPLDKDLLKIKQRIYDESTNAMEEYSPPLSETTG